MRQFFDHRSNNESRFTMPDDNPYAAPQTTDLLDRKQAIGQVKALGPARHFRWFRIGVAFWLLGLAGSACALFLEMRALLFVIGLLFVVGTVLMNAIPRDTPGRVWFGISVVLQILSPVIGLQAIQDVPQPDRALAEWCQGLFVVGEILAVCCVLVGLARIASWCRFGLLLWSARAALGVIACSFLLYLGTRNVVLDDGDVAFFVLIAGLVMLSMGLSLLVCLSVALLLPRYIGRPYAPPYDPHALPSVMELPRDLTHEGHS